MAAGVGGDKEDTRRVCGVLDVRRGRDREVAAAPDDVVYLVRRCDRNRSRQVPAEHP